MNFSQRVTGLPHLGVGISTEYGAGDVVGALVPQELRELHPRFAEFLEIGVDTFSGLDAHARRWIETGAPRAYHFLDLNLDDPSDQDAEWLDELHRLLSWIKPAWICGDAGLWHFGAREPGHNLLLPPILTDPSADLLAEGVQSLREATGYEVLPENPPGIIYLGDLHVLDYFARVVDRADSGMLLDCAHLAIYQRNHGLGPLTALDGFPLERVVELHVAGSTIRRVQGFECVDDDHTPEILPETWQVFEHVIARTPNLRAVVFECERNPLTATLPIFSRIRDLLGSVRNDAFADTLSSTVTLPNAAGECAVPFLARGSRTELEGTRTEARGKTDHDWGAASGACSTALHRAAVRMYFDPLFVQCAYEHPERHLESLSEEERRWVLQADPRAWSAVPKIAERCWTVLEEEFAASVLAIHALDDLALGGVGLGTRTDLREQFFASEAFHGSVTNGGSTAAALAEFLRRRIDLDRSPQEATRPVEDSTRRIGATDRIEVVAERLGALVRALVDLEESMARLRRKAPIRSPENVPEDVITWLRVARPKPERRPPTGTASHAIASPARVEMEAWWDRPLRLSPDRALIALTRGTADLADELLKAVRSGNDSVEMRIRELLEQSLLTGEPATNLASSSEVSDPEYVLLALVRTEGEPMARQSIAPIEITQEFYVLLQEADKAPQPFAKWVTRAIDLGADKDEALAFIAELLEDSTLVASDE